MASIRQAVWCRTQPVISMAQRALAAPVRTPASFIKSRHGGTFSVLTAAGGSVIYAPLLLASDGNLYGVSTNGGAPGDGTAFRVSTDGTNLTILYTFCSQTNCTDGAHPLGGLVEGPDHNLYGTTQYNGANGDYGVVFQLTPAGAYTVLHSFGGANDGNLPRGRLLLASDGYLYGTTASGGTTGAGTIFKIKPDGSNFTVLYAFCPVHNCTAGGYPGIRADRSFGRQLLRDQSGGTWLLIQAHPQRHGHRAVRFLSFWRQLQRRQLSLWRAASGQRWQLLWSEPVRRNQRRRYGVQVQRPACDLDHNHAHHYA